MSSNLKPPLNHRERALLSVLKPHLRELRLEGLRGNQIAFQAFIDIDEMWRDLYGVSVEDDGER